MIIPYNLNHLKKVIVVLYFILLFVSNALYALTFEAPVGTYSLCTMDIELDGDEDIIIGHCYDPEGVDTITVMINQGNMEFDTYYLTENYRHYSMCSGCFNDDEYPDFITVERTDQTIRFYRNNCDGGFDDPQIISNNYGATSLVTTDFENDGDMDVFYLNSYYEYFGFFINNGAGNFSRYLHTDCLLNDQYLSIADMNGDNYPDISLGRKGFINHLDWLEEIFIGKTSERLIYSADVGDFDNDGDYDVYYQGASYPGYLEVALNDGNANFDVSYIGTLPCFSYLYTYITVEDINSDGYDDIIYYDCLNQEANVFFVINDEANNIDHYSYNHFDLLYSYTAGEVLFVDMDNDNDKDAILYSLYPYPYPNFVDFLIILFNDGTGKFSENYVSVNDEIPEEMSDHLLTNYPNPFNNHTMINYSVNKSGIVDLVIYDIKGRMVKELVIDKMVYERNTYTVDWDGKDSKNDDVTSGIYFSKLTTDENVKINKMIIMR